MDLIAKAPDRWSVTFAPPKRTDEQNKRLWAMLNEVAHKARLRGVKYDAYDWKVLFMQALKGELRLAPALDGQGMVPLGYRSSQLTISQMSDLIALMQAWCAENGVELTDGKEMK
jgi:hypothetical protein